MKTERDFARMALVAIFLFLVGSNAGCTIAEDREYAIKVREVLRQASELEENFAMGEFDGLWSVAGDQFSGRQSAAAIDAFKESVEVLPTPRSKRLRYLHMRLRRVSKCASQLGIQHGTYVATVRLSQLLPSSSIGSDSSMARESEQTHARWQELRESLAILTAAERVCLSTSMLWDISRADVMESTTNPSPTALDVRAADSALAAHEQFVRVEVARVR